MHAKGITVLEPSVFLTGIHQLLVKYRNILTSSCTATAKVKDGFMTSNYLFYQHGVR
jgi:hypothetical protein